MAPDWSLRSAAAPIVPALRVAKQANLSLISTGSLDCPLLAVTLRPMLSTLLVFAPGVVIKRRALLSFRWAASFLLS